MRTTLSKPPVKAKEVIIVLAVTCLMFVIVEGLSSAAVSLYQLLSYKPPPEISRYDEFLGWTGIPNTYIPDMYGPGKYVRTNARGFRNEADIEVEMENSKIRIICSGDSFTYGEGVANNHAWCNRMSELDNRLETVNLAQPGYGVDQMFLRYKRDGVALEHSIHIFAFIVGDFTRMRFPDHYQYGKPVMRLDDDALVTENLPVPHYRWVAGRFFTRADFRSVDLANRVLKRLFPADDTGPTLRQGMGPVASKIFQTIRQLGEEKNVLPVFVFLPTERDLGKDHAWYRWVMETMKKLDLPFIDLTPGLRAVPAGKASAFFIAPGKQEAGHYTEAGNQWVAETLYKRITEMPEVRALLDGIESADTRAASDEVL